MRQQEIYYEICTEDEDGFNPRGFSYESLAVAEKELARYHRNWPGENAFIVRTMMTRITNRNGELRLKAV